MSAERPPQDQPEPELARVLRELSDPAPRPEFVDALREKFVSGDFEEDEEYEEIAEEAAPRELRLVPALWLAAAAIVLAIGSFAWLQRERPEPWTWQVLEGSTAQAVHIDGVAVGIASDRLAGMLREGARIETGEGTLRLRIDDRVIFELGTGTDIEFVMLPAPGEGTDIELSAHAGRLAVSTGPTFPGSRLLVRAPDVEVVATGTAFGVDISDLGTCVCCCEGTVTVHTADDSNSGAVEQGQMHFVVHEDGRGIAAEAKAEHLEPAEALRALWL